MHRWRITIDPMPFSGADPKAAASEDGPHHFYVDADDIRVAVKMAECIQQGMKRNPAVWEAPILGVCVEKPRS